MRELEIAPEAIAGWFAVVENGTHSLIQITEANRDLWSDILAQPVRRCYVQDAALHARASALNVDVSEVLAAKLPDEGSTMAGDFGEVLVYLCHAALQHPQEAFGAKKWRLKQDRNKPSPYSDVVQFILPSWPQASEKDTILCSEVKTKSTPGGDPPVAEAIADCAKDRTSRLARTLVWLKDRALGEDLGCVELAHLERFINLIDFPRPRKEFYAVVVICSSLLAEAQAKIPANTSSDYKLMIIAVPELRTTYSAIFKNTHLSVLAGKKPVAAP